MRSVKHQHTAIIFSLTLPCQQLSALQAERSFKKQILMTLPTVTTVSEIGINLAQFRNSGQQPLLTCDTLNSSCSLGTNPRPSATPSLWLFPRLAKMFSSLVGKWFISAFFFWHSVHNLLRCTSFFWTSSFAIKCFKLPPPRFHGAHIILCILCMHRVT